MEEGGDGERGKWRKGGAHLLSLRLAARSLRVPTNDNRPRRKSVNIRLADKQGVYISETGSRIIRDKNRLKCGRLFPRALFSVQKKKKKYVCSTVIITFFLRMLNKD